MEQELRFPLLNTPILATLWEEKYKRTKNSYIDIQYGIFACTWVPLVGIEIGIFVSTMLSIKDELVPTFGIKQHPIRIQVRNDRINKVQLLGLMYTKLVE